MKEIIFVIAVAVVLAIFFIAVYRLKKKEQRLIEKYSKPLEAKSPEPKYGAPGSPVTGHIRFRVDKGKPWTGFLELDGQRIRFLTLKIDNIGPGEFPIVTISVYARLIEGEIMGAQGTIELIHIDKSTLPEQDK